MILDWLDDPHPEHGIHAAGEELTYVALAHRVRRMAAGLGARGVGPGSVVCLALPPGIDFAVAAYGALLAGAAVCPLVPAPTALGVASSAAATASFPAATASFPAAAAGFTAGTAGSTVGAAGFSVGAAGFAVGAAGFSAGAAGFAVGAAGFSAGAAGLAPGAAGLAAGTAGFTAGAAGGPGVLVRDGLDVAAICADGDPAVASPGPGPVALVQLTSGSSGTPRGVRIGWPALSANVAAIVEWLRMTVDDRVASWLPFHHDMGLVGILVTSVTRQADLTLLAPSDFVRDPARFVRLFDRGGATLTAMPAFGLRHVVRRVGPQALADADLSGWRGLIIGAERIDPDVLDRFAARLAPAGFRRSALLPAYGLAEATLMVTGARLTDAPTILPGVVGCGYPVGDSSVSIVDDSGLPVGEGVVGEIVVRGSSLALGYVEETAATSSDDRAAAVDGKAAGVAVNGVAHVDGAPTGGGTIGVTGAPPVGGAIGVEGAAGIGGVVGVDGAAAVGGAAGVDGTAGVGGVVGVFGENALRTGDAGFLRDGELFVVGRFGDSVKVHGQTLFAEELERLAVAAGAPADRVVVLAGVHGGLSIVVLLAERLEPAVLAAAAEAVRPVLGDARLVVFNAPARAIARTTSGKPRRRVLWQNYTRGAGVFAGVQRAVDER